MALVVRAWGHPEHPRFAGPVAPSANCRASARRVGGWEVTARQARRVQARLTGVTLIYEAARATLLATTLWTWGIELRGVFESMNVSMAYERTGLPDKDPLEE